MAQDNKLFFVGLKAFIEKDGKVLILRETFTPYTKERAWELPGGRIQHDEDAVPLESILLREVREECGENLRITVGDVIHVFRRQFSDASWVFLVGYDCKYLSGEVSISTEHTEYQWLAPEDIDTYDFVNGYKEAITEYFRKKAS